MWKADKKDGEGKYFFLDKGQLMEGVWKEDIAKCSSFIDLNRSAAADATKYPLPELTLKNPSEVLEAASAAVL